MSRACGQCLRRAWLLEAVSGHLDLARGHVGELLALGDEDLLEAVAGAKLDRIRDGLHAFDAGPARAEADRAGLELICRCDPAYPSRLRALPSPPAALHVAGGMDRFRAGATADSVAVIGSRSASPYGLQLARSLGRGLAASGLPVVSGMALGIDSAAHLGALEAAPTQGPGPPVTVAVLPGSVSRPYPRSNRGLHRRVIACGAAISELPPGASVRRWMFPARNRIIAALAAMTVVVEARERSGALLTARVAGELGRPVGAVPGRVTSAQAAGSNALLKDGAALVRGPQDVLDLLFEAGSCIASADQRPRLSPQACAVLESIGDGHDTPGALSRRGLLSEDGLAVLAELELAGYIHRQAGGRYAVLP